MLDILEARKRLCIVCPHSQAEHYTRELDGTCWCRPCNKGPELAGPCSYYFIPRHKYEPRPSSSDNNAIWCGICKLGENDMAHQL